MKRSEVEIILNPEDAARAGAARLAKEDDNDITTEEQANQYRGAHFIEGEGCGELHLLYRDGMACVNFINEEGKRVNYDYPIHTLKRVKHIA